MFEKIREIFSKDNLLNQAFQECYDMLDTCKEMCEKSVHYLRSPQATKPDFDIYKMDRNVNKFERSVRKKVLTLVLDLCLNLSPNFRFATNLDDFVRCIVTESRPRLEQRYSNAMPNYAPKGLSQLSLTCSNVVPTRPQIVSSSGLRVPSPATCYNFDNTILPRVPCNTKSKMVD